MPLDRSRISLSRLTVPSFKEIFRNVQKKNNFYFNYEFSRLICSFIKVFRSFVMEIKLQVRTSAFVQYLRKNSCIYFSYDVHQREWLKTAAFREELNFFFCTVNFIFVFYFRETDVYFFWFSTSITNDIVYYIYVCVCVMCMCMNEEILQSFYLYVLQFYVQYLTILLSIYRIKLSKSVQ